jgi:hypothetical protein
MMIDMTPPDDVPLIDEDRDPVSRDVESAVPQEVMLAPGAGGEPMVLWINGVYIPVPQSVVELVYHLTLERAALALQVRAAHAQGFLVSTKFH